MRRRPRTQDRLRTRRRRARSHVLHALLGLTALGVPVAYASENDRRGDAPHGPDLTAVRLASSPGGLKVELAFVGAPRLGDGSRPAEWVGFVDLDTDADASTGQLSAATFAAGALSPLGSDLQLPLDSFRGDTLDVVETSSGEVVGTAPARLIGNVLEATLPPELIGSATGVRANAAVGTSESLTDVAPDGGYVTTEQPSASSVPLRDGRFRVEIEWTDYAGATGVGRLVESSSDSALFWFFDAANWELLIKVLDGCGVNGHYWVYSAATTDVEYRLTVTDTSTGTARTYDNELGQRQPFVGDTEAFPACP